MRICTYAENARNRRVNSIGYKTSKYKGVTKRSRSKNYSARIKESNKVFALGTFSSEIAAANAYNYHATLMFGEFASLNEVPFMNKEEWEKFLCTQETNKYSNHVGVSWHKRHEKWYAVIYKGGKTIHLGYFDSEENALSARENRLMEVV